MFKQVRMNDAILKFYQRSQPIAFSNAETLYDDLVLLRDQILMYGDLSEAQTNYLNDFIEKFDGTLSNTVKSIFEKWLSDGFLVDFIRDLINEEVVGARDGESNLNLRLNRDKQELTKQLEQIVNINVKNFGVVSDAFFKNPDNNKYYVDRNFTIPSTDNKVAFESITAYVNSLGAENSRFKILFPSGSYYSSGSLKVKGKEITIEGINAKLIVSTPNSDTGQECVFVDGVETFGTHGMTFELIIEDKSFTSHEQRLFYHIWAISSGKKFKKSTIYNNTFIDDVSIPNSTAKPYNGSLWLSNCEEVHVNGNSFKDSTGRIIYVSNAKSGNISGNIFENLGYINQEVTTVNVGTLCFRILSSGDINIHDNTIIGTKIYNDKQIVTQGATLSIDESFVMSSNINVYNNTFIANELLFKAFLLYGVVRSNIYQNKVYLNSKPGTSFVTVLPQISSEHERVDVTVENNRVHSLNENIYELNFPADKNNLVKINSINNSFDSSIELKKLTTASANSTALNCLLPIGDMVFKDGVRVYNMLNSIQIDYNLESLRTSHILSLSGSNINDYLDVDGNLDVPKNIKMIEISTSSGEQILIGDILFDGERQFLKEVTIMHLSGTGSVELVFSSAKLRLPSLANEVIKVFESVKLISFKVGYWYKSV